MFKGHKFATIVAGSLMAAIPVLAQEAGRQEASVQAFGSWVKSTTENGVRQGASNSGGVLANYRFFFTKSNGVEVNYGYSLNTQQFGLLGGPIGVKANQHEVTAAYVYRHVMRRFTPFAEVGVGGLVFDPTDAPGTSTQTRAAFVYGAGADFNITHHVFFRGQYRGLVYNSPTFDLVATAGTDRTTHRAQPSIGFGYRF
jgi:opacity protein-like surface antigen